MHQTCIPQSTILLQKCARICTFLSQNCALWDIGMVHCGICAPGPWFNINMSSYQYRKSHCGDKTILRPSYLHNGISYTGKTTSLYWIGALVSLDILAYQELNCWNLVTHTSMNWGNWVIIVSSESMLLVRLQAITWTKADLLSIAPLGAIWIKAEYIHVMKNIWNFLSVKCLSFLFQLQYVN